MTNKQKLNYMKKTKLKLELHFSWKHSH